MVWELWSRGKRIVQPVHNIFIAYLPPASASPSRRRRWLWLRRWLYSVVSRLLPKPWNISCVPYILYIHERIIHKNVRIFPVPSLPLFSTPCLKSSRIFLYAFFIPAPFFASYRLLFSALAGEMNILIICVFRERAQGPRRKRFNNEKHAATGNSIKTLLCLLCLQNIWFLTTTQSVNAEKIG